MQYDLISIDDRYGNTVGCFGMRKKFDGIL